VSRTLVKHLLELLAAAVELALGVEALREADAEA
jgi:hypothetical protein